jgi:hypothetical protein
VTDLTGDLDDLHESKSRNKDVPEERSVGRFPIRKVLWLKVPPPRQSHGVWADLFVLLSPNNTTNDPEDNIHRHMHIILAYISYYCCVHRRFHGHRQPTWPPCL